MRGRAQRRRLGRDLLLAERVNLVQAHQLGSPGEFGLVRRKLPTYGAIRAGHVRLRAVDQVDQDAAALDVAEKAVAEPGAFVGALDQPRDVGDHEAVVVDRHGAELGLERGERIVGDLGARARYRGEKGRLAGIGQAEKPGVGEQLQAQPQPALLAGLARAWPGGAPGWSRT